jgi:ribosomal protein L6P/L9E
VGLTHYTLIEIPLSVQVFCKKRRIYIIGLDLMVFKAFLNRIRKVRKKDIYKGKGLLEVKTYKGFVRMKTGKKKQYN